MVYMSSGTIGCVRNTTAEGFTGFIHVVSAYVAATVVISALNKFGPWQCCPKLNLYKIGP